MTLYATYYFCGSNLIKNELSQLLYTVTAALFIAILIKTTYFFKSTSERTVWKWIYFNKGSLYGSRTRQKLRLKKMQNLLSIILLVLFLSDMLIVLCHIERIL